MSISLRCGFYSCSGNTFSRGGTAKEPRLSRLWPWSSSLHFSSNLRVNDRFGLPSDERTSWGWRFDWCWVPITVLRLLEAGAEEGLMFIGDFRVRGRGKSREETVTLSSYIIIIIHWDCIDAISLHNLCWKEC